MADPEESLKFPTPDEMAGETIEVNPIPEAKDLTDDQIERLLSGLDLDPFMDPEDLKEVLLRRRYGTNELVGVKKEYLLVLAFLVLSVFVFFGYKLYKSLKERQRKREEKKKLKQKKKK